MDKQETRYTREQLIGLALLGHLHRKHVAERESQLAQFQRIVDACNAFGVEYNTGKYDFATRAQAVRQLFARAENVCRDRRNPLPDRIKEMRRIATELANVIKKYNQTSPSRPVRQHHITALTS